MMRSRWISTLALCLAFTGIGLFSGWHAGAGRGGGPAHGTGGQAGEAAPPRLTPQTLANMGVRVTRAELTTFRRTQPVAAVVRALPAFRQKVHAPVAGRVERVTAPFGATVAPGDTLFTLIRNPLPRVALDLTEEVLKPVSDNIHRLMAELQRATVAVEILEKEKKRLRAFTGGEESTPVVPGNRLIQVEYDLVKAQRELQVVRHKLEFHGLDATRIGQIQAGRIPPVDASVWVGALRHNGLWPPLARKLHAILPPRLRRLPWSVATIGELVAGDLAAAELLAWLEETPAARRHFLAVGGLLQQGHTLADIRDLHALRALEEVVRVRAPAGAPDWDVQELLVRPGRRVEAGEPLLVLENPRRLYLRGEPTDGEIPLCLAAMEQEMELAAEPMVAGAAPELAGLAIRRLFDRPGGVGAALHLPLANRPLARRGDGAGRSYRTWRLRPGQRYRLLVPEQVHEGVFVLPAGAVVEDGPARVVFLRSGPGFRRVEVALLHRDHRVAVLPADTGIFPGNPVVTRGAFALKLALDRAGGGDGGHGHTH